MIKRIIRNRLLFILGLRQSLLRRSINNRKQPLKLWYWRHENAKGNFGDEITPEIILSIFGYRTEWTPITECEIIGAGSILETAIESNNTSIKVWGSGFIVPPKKGETKERASGLDYYVVRGEETRSRIDKPHIPLGDPGLLANIVYQKSNNKSNKIGVVAHYVDVSHEVVSKMRNDYRFIVIDPLDRPQEVARQITECKLILSSSLHGLIFADSFGIPNIHIQFSDLVVGGEYKFRDYYSSINKQYKKADATRVLDDDYLRELEHGYEKVINLRKIQRGIIGAFPYK